ncbi:hypothetical protein LCGC14_1704340 [marine sediment metagenome]|uniref:Uncharacterized protein n=1 Tax=marine sediment metagenome TaxID=412755 RepID=A0A0F9JXK4_9ZZZZ
MALCPGIETLSDTSIIGILSYPNICDAQFYAKIMAAIFIILAFGLFMRDRNRETKPDIISAMGVSAIAVIFLSLIGTLIGFITNEIFIEIFVVGMILVVIWMLKR